MHLSVDFRRNRCVLQLAKSHPAVQRAVGTDRHQQGIGDVAGKHRIGGWQLFNGFGTMNDGFGFIRSQLKPIDSCRGGKKGGGGGQIDDPLRLAGGINWVAGRDVWARAAAVEALRPELGAVSFSSPAESPGTIPSAPTPVPSGSFQALRTESVGISIPSDASMRRSSLVNGTVFQPVLFEIPLNGQVSVSRAGIESSGSEGCK